MPGWANLTKMQKICVVNENVKRVNIGIKTMKINVRNIIKMSISIQYMVIKTCKIEAK